jgi:hypothetical protein
VQCPAIAVDLDAPACTARGNVVLGQSPTPVPAAGLITLHLRAQGAVIAANELKRAPGFAILIQDDIGDLTIVDNRIGVAQRAGIGVRDSSVAVRRARISRNLLEGCRGDVFAGSPLASGALVLSECQDISITDNTFAANSPSGPASLVWFVINIADVQGLELNGNTLAENLAGQTVPTIFGSIGVARGRGVVRLQGNLVRDNQGAGLFLQGSTDARAGTHALVQNNHFASPVGVFSVATLQFLGNHLREATGLLFAATANVCSNTVQFAGTVGLGVAGAQLVVSANVVRAATAAPMALFVSGLPMAGLPAQVVVTSNVASGIVAGAATLVRANNIPGP